jgi:ATP-dependent helicase HrpA
MPSASPRHFARGDTPAPVIEVSGRLYPIEMRWRPFEAQKDRRPVRRGGDAVDEAFSTGPGDVLVFMPGEREIRECTRRCASTTCVCPA